MLASVSGAGNVLDEIARAGRQAVSATVTVRGTTVEMTPATAGLELDRGALLRRLTAGATTFDAPFAVVHPAAAIRLRAAPLRPRRRCSRIRSSSTITERGLER